MLFNVCSWNMQGGGNPEKFERLCELLNDLTKTQSHQNMVILLQESGSGVFKTGENYKDVVTEKDYHCLCSARDPAAVVERCTTSILVSSDLAKCTPFCIAYGTYRPLIGITHHLSTIATCHAIAFGAAAVPEVKAFLHKFNPEENWLLMGDFNSAPSSYLPSGHTLANNVSHSINLGNNRHPLLCNIKFPHGFTQGSGGERTALLDFLFSSCSVETSNIENIQLKYSDHNVLFTQVKFPD